MSPLSTSTVLTASGLAVAVGTHASTWGAYKDAPYEGYHPRRQVRTFVLAGVCAWAVLALGLADERSVLPALGVVYALERLATEWWKAILRADDQSAYAIPMRLGIRGRPVEADWLRYLLGALVAAGIAAAGVAIHLAQVASGSPPQWLVVVTVGGLGGWATAVGGAWKDAPIEGFSGWKFLRSPAVATAWAAPLSLITGNWATLSLAAAGMAVASIETYKTFLTGGRAPGKFEGKPIRWVRPRVRRVLGRGHAAGWVGFAVVAAAQADVATASSAAAMAGLVCVLAVVAAVVVLRLNPVLAAVRSVSEVDADFTDDRVDERAA